MNCTIVLALVVGIALGAGSPWSGPDYAVVEGLEEQSPAPEAELDWGDDDLIRDVDSVVQVRLDYHDSLDYLYCLVKYEGDGSTVNIKPLYSVNGGTAWGGPHTYSSVNPIPGLDFGIRFDHVYMVTGHNLPSRQVYLRRFHAHNMRQDTFPRGESIIEVGEFDSDIVDCRLETNHGPASGNVYVGVITADNRIHFRRAAFNDFLFHDLGVGNYPDDARNGLNICWNEERSGDYFLLFSYINTSGQAQVYGFTYIGADTHRFNVSPPTNGSYTGLAAWQDTFMVTYDHVSTDGIQARYMTSYDDGATWRWGFFGDTTTPTVRSADITGRNGYGQAVSYWQYPQQTAGISFTHRRYTGPWSTPVRVQDHNSYSNRLSDIEHIGTGVYGVVYIRGTRNGVAYFDRSDWTGVHEPVPIGLPVPNDTRPTILHDVLFLPSAESGQQQAGGVLLDASGRRVLDLLPGTNDISKVLPGVYFVRSEGMPARNQKLVISR
ncbi:MAG: hypothetical protein JSU73_13285 [candidate division WOR-3 bacterium]|nr:MAG: hypothetical protein JSU73_13285 [candidate division WOR-3 bacterium]